jgi:hypothetical protein
VYVRTGENRDEYDGQRKDKGVVCPKAEKITKTEGALIKLYRDKETA